MMFSHFLRRTSASSFFTNRRYFSEAKSNFSFDKSIKVALIGRPNVGKSTLFNRLTKTKSAIIHNEPGTTRDRKVAKGALIGIDFSVIDTGGLETVEDASGKKQSLELGMLKQTAAAVQEADVLFFIVDGRNGWSPMDDYFARWLRKQNSKGKIHLLANKIEGDPERFDDNLNEFFRLGFDCPYPISAEQGDGIGQIADILIAIEKEKQMEENMALEKEKEIKETMDNSMMMASSCESDEENNNKMMSSFRQSDEKTIQLAIVGRPNVGKSTLLNNILKEERVLTGPQPGVTRDAVAVEWQFYDHKIRLVDTAGIRRIGARDYSNKIEQLSVRDTERTASFSQVVLLVTDMSDDFIVNMDLKIAEKVIEEGRPVVIAANKKDLAEDPKLIMTRFRDRLNVSLAQLRDVPVVPISALTGDGVKKLMPTILSTYKKWSHRETTGKLNRWLARLERHSPPPTVKGKALNVKYISQINTRPPTFAVFVNRPDEVPAFYKRFLSNKLREEFNLKGIPIRILIRGSSKTSKYKKS